MRAVLPILLLAAALTGCGAPPTPTAEQRAAVEHGVRDFARSVAQDVTQGGPLAWQRLRA